MPSFGGNDIFGTCVTMATADNPRQRQVNAFFGLSGLEVIDGGLRGRYTSVSGRFLGATADDVNAAEQTFRALNDGNTYTLVDNFGNEWPDVLLESFEPQGKVVLFSHGVWSRTYTARFQHCS